MSAHCTGAPPQIPDHSLLRVIGRGSYGEVWLARNVMGTLRAVKIVQRAAFDSDRPYLREFEGIRCCEPVSRAHDGLIDILHVGRSDLEGWFYYVMELADATDPADPTDPHDPTDFYRPATLAARIGGGKPLDVTECLRIAESLAGALAFLHEQGLIHRDVKPSNVLYVGGVAKLGDIGLVAEAGSSRSYVGTEGFVPLEGPGTERADIFALGKVLYEALTGMDRSNFPRLPPDWQSAYDFEQRLELNEIVLRACEGDTARRYHSARELLADVALIASGRSVRKMRGMERRLHVLKWAVGCVAAVALAALGGSAMWRSQAGTERALRLRAEGAESAEREGRHSAMLDQVRAARHDLSTGAVTRGLKAAGEAAALGVTAELRDDATFLLGRSDFVMRPDLSFHFTQRISAVEAGSGLMAEMTPASDGAGGQRGITLHVAGAPEKTRAFTVDDRLQQLVGLRFSRGGGRLLASGWYGAGLVLDIATGQVLASFSQGSTLAAPPVFCGEDGQRVIRRAANGGLESRTLPLAAPATPLEALARSGFDKLRGYGWSGTPPLEGWSVVDQRQQAQTLWPSPDGQLVLLIDTALELPDHPPAPAGAACLAEAATGRVLWKVSGPVEQAAAWSPDGTRIAVRTREQIASLDAATGHTVSTVPQRARHQGTALTFLDSRDILAFANWSTSGLIDLAREEMLGLPAVGPYWDYSPASRILAGSTTAEWRPSPVLRILGQPRVATHSVYLSFTPDERQIIIGQGADFSAWNLTTRDAVPCATLSSQEAGGVHFSADGRRAEFLTSAGLHTMDWNGGLPQTLSPPQSLGLETPRICNYTSASADGKVRAWGGSRFIIVRAEGAAPRRYPTGETANPVSVSPDGRWLAVGAQHSTDVRIFDLHADHVELVHSERCALGAFPAFSPDGQWLACGGGESIRILTAGTWTVAHLLPATSSGYIADVSFSRDSRLMAAKFSPTRCVIIEPGTGQPGSWRTRYTLESPLNEMFERCTLSPSGRYFAAVGTRWEVYVWDLQALERELTALHPALTKLYHEESKE